MVAQITAIGYLLVLGLFFFTAIFLTWVAKFYRSKFSKGPAYQLMQGFLALFCVGIFFKSRYIEVPAMFTTFVIVLGAGGFLSLTVSLYRTMMSPN